MLSPSDYPKHPCELLPLYYYTKILPSQPPMLSCICIIKQGERIYLTRPYYSLMYLDSSIVQVRSTMKIERTPLRAATRAPSPHPLSFCPYGIKPLFPKKPTCIGPHTPPMRMIKKVQRDSTPTTSGISRRAVISAVAVAFPPVRRCTATFAKDCRTIL